MTRALSLMVAVNSEVARCASAVAVIFSDLARISHPFFAAVASDNSPERVNWAFFTFIAPQSKCLFKTSALPNRPAPQIKEPFALNSAFVKIKSSTSDIVDNFVLCKVTTLLTFSFPRANTSLNVPKKPALTAPRFL